MSCSFYDVMHFNGVARVRTLAAWLKSTDLIQSGTVHLFLGLLAVTLGLAVVVMRKGTAAHRRAGLFYAVVMVLLNATALMIYDLFGRFGPFHVLALVSLATVSAGVVPVWLRRPRAWLELHARFMSWSYAGLIAAFFSEIGTRVPRCRVHNRSHRAHHCGNACDGSSDSPPYSCTDKPDGPGGADRCR